MSTIHLCLLLIIFTLLSLVQGTNTNFLQRAFGYTNESNNTFLDLQLQRFYHLLDVDGDGLWTIHDLTSTNNSDSVLISDDHNPWHILFKPFFLQQQSKDNNDSFLDSLLQLNQTIHPNEDSNNNQTVFLLDTLWKSQTALFSDSMFAASVNQSEFTNGMTKILNGTGNADDTGDWGALCNAYGERLDQCGREVTQLFNNDSEQLRWLRVFCDRGLTYLANRNKLEKCVTQTTDCTSLLQCFPQYKNSTLAHQNNSTDSSSDSSSDYEYPTENPIFLKRSNIPLDPYNVVAQPSPKNVLFKLLFSMKSIWANLEFSALAATSLIVLFFTIFYLIIHSISNSQQDDYFYKMQNVEVWRFGNAELPCGTPFIYWSGQCLPIHSSLTTENKVCPRGQLYQQKSCRWFWSYGGRQCRVLYCESLCFDIGKAGCSKEEFNLGYDQNGTSTFEQIGH